MSVLLEPLAARCLAIVLAVTTVLSVAVLAVVASRNPLRRERSAEIGIVAGALAFVLVLVPVPGPVGQWTAALQTQEAVEERSSLPFENPPVDLRFVLPEGGPIVVDDVYRDRLKPASPTPSHPTRSWVLNPATETADSKTGEVQSSLVVATVFLCGAIAMLAYLVFSAVALIRLARRASPPPHWLQAMLPENCEASLLLCRESARPFCFGFLRARIVVPSRLVRRRNAQLLRCVVQHELAHIQLGHHRWRQVVAACSPLLFAHPLYWWLARSQREAVELLADDHAAVRTGKRAYVEQLVSLVQQLRPTRPSTSAFLPLSVLGAPETASGPFYERMRMLLTRPDRLQSRLTHLQSASHGLLSAAVLVATTLAFGCPVTAQNPTPSPTETTNKFADKPGQPAGLDRHPAGPARRAPSQAKEPAATFHVYEPVYDHNGRRLYTVSQREVDSDGRVIRELDAQGRVVNEVRGDVPFDSSRSCVDAQNPASGSDPHQFEIVEQVVDDSGKLLAIYTTTSGARQRCGGHFEVTDRVLDAQGRLQREVRTFDKAHYFLYRISEAGRALGGEWPEIVDEVYDAQGRLLHTVLIRETDPSGGRVIVEQRIPTGRELTAHHGFTEQIREHSVLIFDGTGRESADFMLLEVVRAENVSEAVFDAQGQVRHRITQRGFNEDGNVIYEVWERPTHEASGGGHEGVPESENQLWDDVLNWPEIRDERSEPGHKNSIIQTAFRRVI